MHAAENDRPPSYLSHEEQASAPAYAAGYTPPSLPLAPSRPSDWPDTYGDRAPASQALAPSGLLQRPDRLELDRFSTPDNIRIAYPTPSWPAGEEMPRIPSDDHCKGCGTFAWIVLLAAVFSSMVSSAVYAKRDAVALRQNSNVLKDLTSTVLTIRETKTIWDTKVWNTKTVTEEATKTVTVTEIKAGLTETKPWFDSFPTPATTGMNQVNVEIHTVGGERLRKREKTIGEEYVDEKLCTTTTFFPWGRYQASAVPTVRVCCPPVEIPESEVEK